MTKEQIIRRFNLGAKTYHSAADIQLIAAKKLSVYLNRTANQILEIGCGTGVFSQYLVNQFKNKSICLTDIAPEMLRVARDRFATCSNVNTFCQDGENLTLNAAYDLIVSNMVLHWFGSVFTGIKNILDHLSQGGSFIFAMLGNNSLKEWRDICRSSNDISPTLNFISVEEIKNYYPNIELSVEKYSINYPNAHAFLRTLRNIGGTVSYANSRLTARELRRLLRQFQGPFPLTYEVIYGCYVKP